MESLLNNVRVHLLRTDGAGLAQVLKTWEVAANSSLMQQIDRAQNSLQAQCERHLSAFESWGLVVSEFLLCCLHLNKNDPASAFPHIKDAAQKFYTVFDAEQDAWLLPVFISLSSDLRIVAEKAQQQGFVSGLSEALETLRIAFRTALKDKTKTEPNKKQGCVHIVNHLLKISFKMNNMQLGHGFDRDTQTPSFPPEQSFPLAQRVTISFFKGRLQLLDGDFDNANERLLFCLEHCPRRAKHNKRLILLFLIPIRMLCGKFPTAKLLHKYNLTAYYSDISTALLTGQLWLFEQSMQRHQAVFLRLGLFLVLQKAKLVAYRNLFRQVHRIVDSTMIELEVLIRAVRFSSQPPNQKQTEQAFGDDEADVECIVANLIFLNLIKGYISHHHKKLVIAKTDAFPQLERQLFTKMM